MSLPRNQQRKRSCLITIFALLFAWLLPLQITYDSLTDMEILQVEVLVDEVRECLGNLATSKARGPDGIPARLLRECCEQIAPSLCAIFNLWLSKSKISYEWKTADITPIHKKESKEPAENYRPISLLNIVRNVLERCVGSRFYDHVKHSITLLQHGFLRNRSCVHPVIVCATSHRTSFR